MKRKSKKQLVLEHLQSGKTITGLDALSLYGAYRLSGIIHQLRKSGYVIITLDTHGKDTFGNSTNFATYKLIETEA